MLNRHAHGWELVEIIMFVFLMILTLVAGIVAMWVALHFLSKL